MKLKFKLNSKGEKVYTLKEKDSEPAHYKYIGAPVFTNTSKNKKKSN